MSEPEGGSTRRKIEVESGSIQDAASILSTFVDGDGAIPGRHLIGVTPSKQRTKIKHGEPEDTFLVPEVYATPSSSRLTAEVQAEGKNDIEIRID